VKTAQQRDAEGTLLATSDVNGSWSGAPPRGRSHIGRTKPARRSQWSESARLLAPVHHCLLPTSGPLMFSWILSDTLRSFWTVALALVQNLLRVSRSSPHYHDVLDRIYPSAMCPSSYASAPSPASSDTTTQLMDNIRYRYLAVLCAWSHHVSATTATSFVFDDVGCWTRERACLWTDEEKNAGCRRTPLPPYYS
jgi:hypothetical protein